MPRYDYDCAACGTRFEVAHGVTADPPTTCPICGAGPIKKAFAPPTIHFKGSGWAKKERRSAVAPGATRTTGGDAVPAAGESGVGKGDVGKGDAGTGDAGKGDAGTGDAGKERAAATATETPAAAKTTTAPSPTAD